MFLITQTLDFGLILLFISLTKYLDFPFFFSDSRDLFWVFITKFYILFSVYLFEEDENICKIIFKRVIIIILSCLIFLSLMLLLKDAIYTVFFIIPTIINICYILIFKKKIIFNILIDIIYIIGYSILVLIFALSVGK